MESKRTSRSKTHLPVSRMRARAGAKAQDGPDERRDPRWRHGASAGIERQLDAITRALGAARDGDFSVRLDASVADPRLSKIATAFNDLVARDEALAGELSRLSRVIGREGQLSERVSLPNASGAWAGTADAVNALIESLAWPPMEVARVITAVAEGDLSQQMDLRADGHSARGEFLRISNTVNQFVEQLRAVSQEVTRVAREVGAEGKLGAQADLKGLSGTWRDLTSSVNMLAGNLTNQVRNVALVTTAVANGDLSQKITVEARGEILELKDTINTMVDQLRAFAAEVTRVAREVGTEGNLGGQAEVKGVSGTWKDLTDNVNLMASNLTGQVRGIVKVVTAVANGDLTQKFVVEAKGEIAALADTINNMTGTLRVFAEQVVTVAREVGIEGKLGGQANVPGASGTWKNLTDNVNLMASNLTSQVRGIVRVVTAVANGDLSQNFTIEAKGEIAALADTINSMTETLRIFADQVITVAREVGIEGKLGGQANVPGAAGTWRDLTANVNMLAGNLTGQVRNIALVTTAVAGGDLSQKITVDAKGEILELKDTINTMVDQLRTFASEVTRVAREVGTEGKLGGQADVRGVAGTWKDLTDSVNSMAGNLTAQVRNIALVTKAIESGDLSKKITVDVKGEIRELKDTINKMVDQLSSFAAEVTRVAREVGTEGKLGGQANVPGAAGTWRDLTDNVNMLASNLTSQVRNIALVTTAVANGDLSRKITVDARGEILELKDTINAMVEQLRTFAAEVTRVAREVGTEGKLGGQGVVPGVAGTWKDLTDNVNQMASNLTSQVRGIVQVVTAVANGDLDKKLAVAAKGEIAALADTINAMTDTLRTFAAQVTTVAREVGIEGKLGGQAKVPGAAGTWRDLTDNVNQLAGNLTTQVRAISEVATAVTKGDLTRTIDVEAEGEVLALKDTINQMIANLRDTTQTNKEQDWLKTNLAKFSGMMQGQRSLESLAELIMSELTPVASAQLGTFFVTDSEPERPTLRLLSSYGYVRRKNLSSVYARGEGLVGQAAVEKKPIVVANVPPDYVAISSSLGESSPRNIIVLPILFEGRVRGVIELGSFDEFSRIHLTFLEQLALSIGVVMNMISASRRTEELLEELKRSNAQLEQRSNELEEKASLLEVRNREIAEAGANLEEKAKQLALVSKYKSEFLANMSHELRTPLNSIMILASLLSDNAEKNLTASQIEYAQTIHSSGKDLLALINQILDLSKIEAGKMEIQRRRVPLDEIKAYVEQHFQPIARQKSIRFEVSIAREGPRAITTDPQRLQQILKNLLSNAFKFTESGAVDVRMALEPDQRHFQSQALQRGSPAMAFAISDTGIGVAADKQQIIFEAFQQADASTARVYGGTGLGLTISRELARLLGGEIHLRSAPGIGSTFTLYLPVSMDDLVARAAPPREVDGPEAAYLPAPPPSLPEPAKPPSPPASAFVPRTSRPAAEVASEPPARGGPPAVAPPPRPSGPPAGELAGRRIVVIDDDVRNLFAVTSLLERYGATVIPAGSAREAFEVLDRDPDVELVLMDMMMPEVDGYTATRELRKHPRYGHLPVVALTAKAMPGDREKVIEAGCNDFIPKPVERDQIVTVLKRWLRIGGDA